MSDSELARVLPLVTGAFLHGLRLLPAALRSPALGGPAVPGVARLAFALGLGACAAAGAPPPPTGGLALAGCALAELGTGVVLGFLATIPFEAARGGGRLVDTLRGATLAELHVAPLRQQETATGDLLAHATVALAATSGGGRLVVSALLGSFQALPAGSPLGGGASAAVLRGGAELLACALCVAAPAAAGVLAADLVVALAARVPSGAGLPSGAQPARAGIALAALALGGAAIAGRLTESLVLSVGLMRAVPGGAP